MFMFHTVGFESDPWGEETHLPVVLLPIHPHDEHTGAPEHIPHFSTLSKPFKISRKPCLVKMSCCGDSFTSKASPCIPNSFTFRVIQCSPAKTSIECKSLTTGSRSFHVFSHGFNKFFRIGGKSSTSSIERLFS